MRRTIKAHILSSVFGWLILQPYLRQPEWNGPSAAMQFCSPPALPPRFYVEFVMTSEHVAFLIWTMEFSESLKSAELYELTCHSTQSKRLLLDESTSHLGLPHALGFGFILLGRRQVLGANLQLESRSPNDCETSKQDRTSLHRFFEWCSSTQRWDNLLLGRLNLVQSLDLFHMALIFGG